MRAFGIYELREHSAVFLLRGRHAELYALRTHFLMEFWKIVHREAEFDAACGLAFRCRMQREARLACGKLAPARRLEFERQPDHVAIKLHRAVHVRYEFDHVG